MEVPAGDFDAGPADVIHVPASCRIVAVARPTSDSAIGFELWLPAGWNGRYAQLGNGGFAGNIDHPSLAAEIRRGNAAAMTDTGHKASQFDASWALGHPQKIVDYGYRSIKVTADASSSLIMDYYTRPARRRYFIGCSNGGRQALMAAQRYPADWDGILAGSPAVQWTAQLAKFGMIQHHLRSEPDNWISAAKLAVIQRAAIAQCGEQTQTCRLEVRRVVCHRPDGPKCLTQPQASTLAMIQSNPFGFDPRFADLPQNWDQWILNPDRTAPSELAFATSAYRYFVHDNRGWQIERFDPLRDPSLISERRVAGQRLAHIINADDPDLSRFQSHGGKLIMYTGTADALISPRAGVDYYEQLLKRVGPNRARSFARLFIVNGMQHCQGGVGPTAFGQAWVAPALKPDPQHDVRLALEAFVEEGRVPQSIIAVENEKSSGRRARTRRIGAY